jgi:hypothetical protein
VHTRLILILFSALGAVATMAALTWGSWPFASALYVLTILGLFLLLRSAVRLINAESHSPGQGNAPDAAPKLDGAQDLPLSQNGEPRDQRDRSKLAPGPFGWGR